MTGVRSDEILSKRIDLGVQGFGLERQKAIHGHLFQDVYEWAGKTRTVPSSKRMDNGMVSVFANPDTFEESWQVLEQKTNAFVNAKDLTFEQKRDALVEIFIEANRIHPFPEGNGRSLQVFMKELAREQGVELDYSKTNAKDWNMASAISGTYGRLFERKYLIANPSDSEPIKKIFSDMASPSRGFELGKSLREIEEAARKLKSKPLPGGLTAVVERADPQATKPYHGKIVAATEHHALQQLGANKFVIHDRSKCAAQDLTVGKCATIAYGQAKDMPVPKAKDKGLQR